MRLTGGGIPEGMLAVSRFSHERKSLPRQVADFILEDVIKGRGVHVLPGERLLAKEAGVSRQTVQDALALLEAEGVLEPKEGRKARRVAALEGSKASKVLLYLRNQGLVRDREIDRSEKRYFETWEASGGSLIVKNIDFIYHKQPPVTFIRRMVEQYGVDAIVLDIAPKAWISGALDSGLPCYCRGGDQPDSDRVSGIGYYMPETLAEVMKYLASMGHERMLIPCDPYFTSVLDTMRAVYAEQKGMEPEDAEVWVPHFSEMNPAAWEGYWDRSLVQVRPTVVVCTSVTATISFIAYCNQKRLRIPEDVSLLLMDYDENLTWYQPAIQMMAYPYERSDKHFERWVKGGLRPIGMKIFDLEMMPGGASVKDLANARSCTW